MRTYRIRFVNENYSLDVLEGTSLLEAQIQAGLRPDAPCGGRGSCGKCPVDVRFKDCPDWQRLRACTERVHSDLEVRTLHKETDMQILTDAGEEMPSQWNPWIRAVCVRVKGCKAGRPAWNWKRFKSAMRENLGNFRWKADPGMTNGPTRYLSAGNENLWAVMDSNRVLDVSREKPEIYMAAFDLGTTTIAGYLLHGESQEIQATATMLNPQIRFGADVISRANYTLEHGLSDVTGVVRSALNELIGQVCASAGISRKSIYAVSLVGNTCMHHLFLGVNLRSLVCAPYKPVIAEEMTLRASVYGLDVHPSAHILMPSVIAGFVGADTVACLVSGDWQDREACTLLIDIGTNGELVLGNRHRRIACSTAAGPALEGARIQCGMRGCSGAVNHVRLENGVIRWHVIGDVPAEGICGSGLVDLIAVLLRSGRMDESGKLQCGKEFRLGDTKVVLTQKDIREVQLAKAAIAAGIRLLAKKMGIGLDEIEEVHIAGAFGSYMDPDNAFAIGLIPAELRGKLQIVGNAAGKGAQRILTCREAWENAVSLARNTEFLELASMPEFQDVFVDELEFPEVEAQ